MLPKGTCRMKHRTFFFIKRNNEKIFSLSMVKVTYDVTNCSIIMFNLDKISSETFNLIQNGFYINIV